MVFDAHRAQHPLQSTEADVVVLLDPAARGRHGANIGGPVMQPSRELVGKAVQNDTTAATSQHTPVRLMERTGAISRYVSHG